MSHRMFTSFTNRFPQNAKSDGRSGLAQSHEQDMNLLTRSDCREHQQCETSEVFSDEIQNLLGSLYHVNGYAVPMGVGHDAFCLRTDVENKNRKSRSKAMA